jgi:hypothetical protein
LDRVHERRQAGSRVRPDHAFEGLARDYGPALDQADRLQRRGPVVAGARRRGVREISTKLAEVAANQPLPL